MKKLKKFDELEKSYWKAIKEEIRILICTDDEKYSDLRKNLNKYAKDTKTPVVATISATIAGYLGVAAGVISGLVSIALYAVVKIGLNAYCALSK